MAAPTSFNITVDDTSPQIFYAPFVLPPTDSQPNLDEGWNQAFAAGSGFATFPGQPGAGQSLHVTGRANASFTVQFTGTGITLYGAANVAGYSVVLDDTDTTEVLSTSTGTSADVLIDPVEGVLASFPGLQQGNHTVTLTALTTTTNNASLIIFDRAVITVSLNVTNATVSNLEVNDAQLQLNGSWSSDPDVTGQDNSTYTISSSAGDKASFTFQGAAVQLNGLLNATAGSYSVSLTSPSNTTNNITGQFSAANPFLTLSTLFYASGLDPDVNHTLTVTNLENQTLGIDGMNITVISGGVQVSPTPIPSPQGKVSSGISEYPRGAIAAIAVAAVLGFVLVVFLIAFVVWRRMRRRVEKDEFITFRTGPGSTGSGSRRGGLPEIIRIEPRPDSFFQDQDAALADTEVGHDIDEGFKSTFWIDDDPEGKLEETLEYHDHRGSQRSSIGTATTNANGHNRIPIIAPRPSRIVPSFGSITGHRRDNSHSTQSSFLPRTDMRSVSRASPFPFPVDFKEEDEDGNRSSWYDVPIKPTRTLHQTSSNFLEPRAADSGKARDTLYSFLDFASSAASSIRAVTRSRSRSLHSSRQNGSSSSNSNSNGRRHTQRSSALSFSSPSLSRSPRLNSLPLSISAGSTSGGTGGITDMSSLRLNTDAVDPLGATQHPYSLTRNASTEPEQSPTESIPMTVSDINFRTDDTNERRISDLPPHPPLASLQTTPTSAIFTFRRSERDSGPTGISATIDQAEHMYIAQALFGRRNSAPGPSTQSDEQSVPQTAMHSPVSPSSPTEYPGRSRAFRIMSTFGRRHNSER